jgi:putative flavoprotein involved in K+ transport
MRSTGTVVIGGGQAGLAVSHHLTRRGHDHVVLERGQVGERWRSASWDSLHLLTPNWMSRLPGWAYAGPRPQGYLAAAEVVDYLVGYEQSFHAPVQPHTTVESVRRTALGFEVLTDSGSWRAGSVVVATGWCDQPARSPVAAGLNPRIAQSAAASSAGAVSTSEIAPRGATTAGTVIAASTAGPT